MYFKNGENYPRTECRLKAELSCNKIIFHVQNNFAFYFSHACSNSYFCNTMRNLISTESAIVTEPILVTIGLRCDARRLVSITF